MTTNFLLARKVIDEDLEWQVWYTGMIVQQISIWLGF